MTKRKHFDNTSYTTGLNIALQTAFYPHYDYKKAKQGKKYTVVNSFPDDMCKNPKARGKQMDRLVDRMVHLIQDDGFTLEDLIGNSKSSSKKLKRFQKDSTVYMREQLIPYLIRKTLVPFESQVHVYDKKKNIGTSIDLICKTIEGKLAIIEIKVGFDCYYELHTGKCMNHPFEDIEDSLRWQHQLYLSFAVDMIEKQRKIKVDRELSAVVRMSSDGINIYPIFPWDIGSKDIAWNILASRSDWNNKERKKYIGNCRRKRTKQLD